MANWHMYNLMLLFYLIILFLSQNETLHKISKYVYFVMKYFHDAYFEEKLYLQNTILLDTSN